MVHGNTEPVEHSQIEDMTPHWGLHPPSGWMTENIFEQDLEMLHYHFYGSELHLPRDSCTAHRTQDVKEAASELNITVYFILPGMTDALQPRNRRISAVSKVHGK
jgi:hypothetical protein